MKWSSGAASQQEMPKEPQKRAAVVLVSQNADCRPDRCPKRDAPVVRCEGNPLLTGHRYRSPRAERRVPRLLLLTQAAHSGPAPSAASQFPSGGPHQADRTTPTGCRAPVRL
ncbi:hypothetical protein NDU88_002105 [Pleurodeles waltl]|uniref:Uncharacterized protein n=1 Tax=Pleurodeles waltl TaxID=8319 RepID=A0AAV7Q7Z3_PLEWA|nr:hypothetical protein NDU88_002105 [Pleurodeles waltl]